MPTWWMVAGALVAGFTMGSWMGIRFGIRQCDSCGSWLTRAPLPACGMKGCLGTSAHTHAPGTGWIRPDSWDYENNRPKCTHNVMAAVGGYEGRDLHCLDCRTDLTTGEKL